MGHVKEGSTVIHTSYKVKVKELNKEKKFIVRLTDPGSNFLCLLLCIPVGLKGFVFIIAKAIVDAGQEIKSILLSRPQSLLY